MWWLRIILHIATSKKKKNVNRNFRFQGFMVAIFYCFVNSEVKNTFKHHFLRWNDARNLRTGGSRRFTYSKDWSPNTRSDSVRYYFKAFRVRRRTYIRFELWNNKLYIIYKTEKIVSTHKKKSIRVQSSRRIFHENKVILPFFFSFNNSRLLTAHDFLFRKL